MFARTGLRFVYNAVSAKSLTNFHCLYPRTQGEKFARALLAVVNSSAVRETVANHQRGFGGGLSKLEPRDLISVPVPDLRKADDTMLEALALALDEADAPVRVGATNPFARIDDLLAEFGRRMLPQVVDETSHCV